MNKKDLLDILDRRIAEASDKCQSDDTSIFLLGKIQYELLEAVRQELAAALAVAPVVYHTDPDEGQWAEGWAPTCVDGLSSALLIIIEGES